MCFIYVFILYILTEKITQLQQKNNKYYLFINLLLSKSNAQNAQNIDYIQNKLDELGLADCGFSLSYYTAEMELRGNLKHIYKKCEDQVIEYYYEKNDRLFNKRKYETCKDQVIEYHHEYHYEKNDRFINKRNYGRCANYETCAKV
jgi:hypothetical protein